jgi:hypothetical protein
MKFVFKYCTTLMRFMVVDDNQVVRIANRYNQV